MIQYIHKGDFDMEKTKCFREATDKSYSYAHKITSDPISAPSYYPHVHYGVEIYILLQGKVDYIIEGNTYSLSQFDILIMNENELHNPRLTDNTEYERIVINILPDFFEMYGINDYKKIFTDKKPGRDNLIKSYLVHSEGLYEILQKIEKYIKESTPENDMIVRSSIIELLHILNKTSINSEHAEKKNTAIAKIVSYINKNISQPLTLESVSQKFYISKYHLCRIFKEHMGMTFNRYITAKRIALVRHLCNEGMNISEAATSAGFGNYSNFYKSYVSFTGQAPKEDLKIKRQ